MPAKIIATNESCTVRVFVVKTSKNAIKIKLIATIKASIEDNLSDANGLF